MKRLKLFLNFDNNLQHRPVCLECKKELIKRLHSDCFTNPLDYSHFKRYFKRNMDSFL